MKTFLATAAVSALLLAACGTAGGSGAPIVNANAWTVNATLTDSKVAVDQGTVPTGKITFNVKNAGTVVNELVLLKTDLAPDKIPADMEELGKMSEAPALARAAR